MSSYDDSVEELDGEVMPLATTDAGTDAGAAYVPPADDPPAYQPPIAFDASLGPSAPRDASVARVDASSPARDAGSSVNDASTPPRDAGASTPTPDAGGSSSNGRCLQDSECTNECVPVGLFSCCDGDGKCGCTWVPGAYCS